MQVKGVRLYAKDDIRLEEFELPEIKDDEILVKVMSDSICMSTWKMVKQGADHKRVPADVADHPIIIGHEFAGDIVKVGKKWQDKFRYILVDEFQDINQVQYDVIRMLAAPENNLFVVGDDDQSVYGFRGAKPGIMKDFMRDYPAAKRILLDINYRSNAHIVKGALRVIGHNKDRYEKEIQPFREAQETVHVQETLDPLDESKYILKEILFSVIKVVIEYLLPIL